MKKIFLLTIVFGLVLASTGCGPGYRTQQGAIIGATVGAIAGHDIGENAEGALIGAAVGGVAGAVIGDAMEQYEADNSYQSPYNQTRQPYQAPPRRY